MLGNIKRTMKYGRTMRCTEVAGRRFMMESLLGATSVIAGVIQSEIGSYINQMNQNNSVQHSYSKVLTISSWTCAIVGALAGIGVAVMLFTDSDSESSKDIKSA